MSIDIEPSFVNNAFVLIGYLLMIFAGASSFVHFIWAAPPSDMEPCKAIPRALVSAVICVVTAAALLARSGIEL